MYTHGTHPASSRATSRDPTENPTEDPRGGLRCWSAPAQDKRAYIHLRPDPLLRGQTCCSQEVCTMYTADLCYAEVGFNTIMYYVL